MGWLIAVAAICAGGGSPLRSHAADDSPVFEDRLAGVLQQRCGKCHGAETQKGAFALHTPAALQKGSETGPVITPGQPDDSRLYEVVSSGEMPPRGETPLTAEEQKLLHDWLLAGAKFRDRSSSSDQVTQHQVLPIFWLRCTVCHGGRRREAGLDLRTRESVVRGGQGGPAVVPGDPAASLLLRRLHAGEMPPKDQLTLAMVKPLETAEIDTISRWIEQGATEVPFADDRAGQPDDPLVRPSDRAFWAFQPPRRTPVPAPTNRDAARTPIDLFLLQKLEEHQLDFAPPASPETLLRRASFDLTGLPPSPDDLALLESQFRNLPDGGWDELWSRWVERLLASPRYGERWGRH